jgi:hypothetical protein
MFLLLGVWGYSFWVLFCLVVSFEVTCILGISREFLFENFFLVFDSIENTLPLI